MTAPVTDVRPVDTMTTDELITEIHTLLTSAEEALVSVADNSMMRAMGVRVVDREHSTELLGDSLAILRALGVSLNSMGSNPMLKGFAKNMLG